MMGNAVEMFKLARREQLMGKMVTRYGFEDMRTIKFCETAENKEFSDDHVEIVFQALYGGE